MCAARSNFVAAVGMATAMAAGTGARVVADGTTAAARAPTAIPMVTAAGSAPTRKDKGKDQDRVKASPVHRTDSGLAVDAGGVGTSHPDHRRTNRS